MAAADEVLRDLRAMGDPRNVEGMLRFGITPQTEMLGIGVTALRKVARAYRGDHDLALALWVSGVHEARHLAAMIDDPARVTKKQMETWARSFDSWDITDGVCTGLFDRTPHALDMVARWSGRRAEFVRRGAFSMIAGMAVHDKRMPDEMFIRLLPIIEAAADDDRNFVRKAVNWALRQIGKRNDRLNVAAIDCAERVKAQSSRSARWIAADALRELRSDAVRAKLRR